MVWHAVQFRDTVEDILPGFSGIALVGEAQRTMTPYHSQYWAHALTLQSAAGSIETLSRSLSKARVDLNPHQVDAALFAPRSPLSKGVILSYEVGLGKTIEPGIVIAQHWAERRRQRSQSDKVLTVITSQIHGFPSKLPCQGGVTGRRRVTCFIMLRLDGEDASSMLETEGNR